MRATTPAGLLKTVQCLGLAVLLAGASSSALACKFRPDPRPWAEQVQATTGPVFLGRVISVSEREAQFEVEQWVPAQPLTRTTVPVGGTSCHIRFAVGQRWLFAGNTLMSPSRLLDDGEPLPAEVQQFMHKH